MTAKRVSAKSLKEALQAIVDLPDEAGLNGAKAIAAAVLSASKKPSAMEQKVSEVATFMIANFGLIFAGNEAIADALNAAGILSPTGKEWTRSNVSKVMVGVKEEVTRRMSAASGSGADQEAEDVVPAPEVSEAPEAAPKPAPAAAEPVSEAQQVEDDILAALDDIDDLVMTES